MLKTYELEMQQDKEIEKGQRNDRSIVLVVDAGVVSVEKISGKEDGRKSISTVGTRAKHSVDSIDH